MPERKFLGIWTILCSLPGFLAGLLILLPREFPLWMTIYFITAVFLRGLPGLIGGILLYRGQRWGYKLSLICWCFILLNGIFSFIRNENLDPVPGLEEYANSTYWKNVIKCFGSLAVSIPVSYLLFQDLRTAPSEWEEEQDEEWEEIDG